MSATTTDSRESIFARIREALTNPATPHHRAVHPENVAPESTLKQWLPAVGSTLDEQIALFAENCVALKAEFKACSSLDEAVAHINQLAADNQWTKIATHHSELTDAVASKLSTAIYHADETYDKLVLETCNAGLTGCEALVSQTGSVCITPHASGGRSLSILPPHHIVIARRSQIVADLPATYALIKERYSASGYPSFISFSTGPSRTGDIERILVLGAHGPKRLTVLLIP
jgi:L-lactate dehydrogenase complex protein LldG